MKEYEPNKNTVVMSCEQVRSFDKWAINTLCITGVVLMENAGRSCAELIKNILASKSVPKVAIICGTGNNGGDGFVIARHLLNWNFGVSVFIIGRRDKIKGDAKINLEILEKMGQKIVYIDLDRENFEDYIKNESKDADLIVDAIFGTGLSGRLDDKYRNLINCLNSSNIDILSVDIPSGLDCDTGQILGAAVKAAYTVTFVAFKKGFASQKAKPFIGKVYIASIGVETFFKK